MIGISLLILMSTQTVFGQENCEGLSSIARDNCLARVERDRANRDWRDSRDRGTVDYGRAAVDTAAWNDRYSGSSRGADGRLCDPNPPAYGPSQTGLPPCAGATGSNCRINYSSISRITYSEHNLNALVVRGVHTIPSQDVNRFSLNPNTEFSVIDDDGFLTLSAIVSSWQEQGLASRNLNMPVTVPKKDVELALEAARIGVAYQTTLIGILNRTPAAQRQPDHQRNLDSANDRKVFMEKVIRDLNAQIGSVASAAVNRNLVLLPRYFMRDGVQEGSSSVQNRGIAGFLENFAPDAQNRILAQYGDSRMPSAGRQILCNPQATSELIGRAFCYRDFIDNERRDPNFCSSGITYGDIATAPFCEERRDEVTQLIRRVNCRRGVSGDPITAPAGSAGQPGAITQ
jgi:hypothetical protein